MDERTSYHPDLARDPSMPGDSNQRVVLGDYLFLFAFSGVIILLDQWTKALVRSNLELSQVWVPFPSLEFLRIVHWQNTGAAFGLFQGFSGLFTILAIVVSGAILYYYPRVPRHDWALRLAMAFQLGGAVGNLISRVTVGKVTDFVAVGSFPVFNVADASITIGVVLLIGSVWIKDRPHPSTGSGSPSGDVEAPLQSHTAAREGERPEAGSED